METARLCGVFVDSQDRQLCDDTVTIIQVQMIFIFFYFTAFFYKPKQTESQRNSTSNKWTCGRATS